LSYAPTVGISGKAQTKIIAFNFRLRVNRAPRSGAIPIIKDIPYVRPSIPLVEWFVRKSPQRRRAAERHLWTNHNLSIHRFFIGNTPDAQQPLTFDVSLTNRAVNVDD
jgi:hypothetical protein